MKCFTFSDIAYAFLQRFSFSFKDSKVCHFLTFPAILGFKLSVFYLKIRQNNLKTVTEALKEGFSVFK